MLSPMDLLAILSVLWPRLLATRELLPPEAGLAVQVGSIAAAVQANLFASSTGASTNIVAVVDPVDT